MSWVRQIDGKITNKRDTNPSDQAYVGQNPPCYGTFVDYLVYCSTQLLPKIMKCKSSAHYNVLMIYTSWSLK